MVNSGTYYGLSLSASNLGGNPYYNYLISAGVEIPAYAFNLLVLDRPWMGRRRALAGCMLFAGLVLVVTIFVPKVSAKILILYCEFRLMKAAHSWPISARVDSSKTHMTCSFRTSFIYF